jgi:D-alanyl-D-alanine carboxypeptidase
MDQGLTAALDYLPRWLAFQVRLLRQPGCAIAIAHRGETVLDAAFGSADLATGEPLTPRHRFRVASHSKSFTAAGILKLRELGRLRLDDAVGAFVPGLPPAVAEIRLGQLLSHSGGLVRDGADNGQFGDRRPYLSAEEVRRDLAVPSPFEPEVRFKYSNHGFALLGLVIEAVTGEPYAAWIRRTIVEPAGLEEVEPEVGGPRGVPMAKGHSGELPLGHRVVVAGDNPTNAITAAAGFVSTARDLARFFAQLAPAAPTSILSTASRREMVRRLWRDEDIGLERYYGLGIISGAPGPWQWFGHSGGFQGFITRTSVLPAQELAVAVLTNAIDGPAHVWMDGVVAILKRFAEGGDPRPETAAWTGRWWSLWSAFDLVPVGGRVVCAAPGVPFPLADVSEIEVTGPDEGRIVKAPGFGSVGEPARLIRGDDGSVAAVRIGGATLVPEAEMRREMLARYGPRSSA